MVKDEQGIPLAGVNVVAKGSSVGVSTDFDGKFTIKVPEKISVLVFSSVGMKTQERKIQKEKFLSVVMQEDLTEIEEIVVTGYQQVSPEKVATSYTKIDTKSFEKRGSSDVLSGLEGLSSALVISTNPNNPTGSKEFSIRGISTLSGNTRPLIVLDGFQYEGSINDINPYEVESITLLKDAASASIYGAKSSNGVIVITTKRGKRGKTQIRYTSNISFQNKSDIAYEMNRISSANLVDMQHKIAIEDDNNGFIQSYRHLLETDDPEALSYANSTNRVYYLYGLKKYGYITESDFNNQLTLLKTYDNTDDLRKIYLQTPLINQQNLSISGGTDLFLYRSSLNYTNTLGKIKGTSSDRVLFDFIANAKLSPKVSFDFQTNLAFNKANTTSVRDAFQISSYDRFLDNNGNPLAVFKPFFNLSADSGGEYGGKDPDEIQRLVSLGLFDETYYPAIDFHKYKKTSSDWSARFQGSINIQLLEGLQAKVEGQLLKNASVSEGLALADSWEMKSLINNTTPLSYDGDPKKLNIPYGARLKQVKGEFLNYLVRTQFDFKKSFANHHVDAILGAEIKEDLNESTAVDRFGYDPKSNLFNYVSYTALTEDILDVYHPSRDIPGGVPFSEFFGHNQNRYVSAYSNLTYRYSDKYVFTGSIRMDQSNLFGTDPKYRYRPFWSLAGRWKLGQENFLKERNQKIDLRVSYGINGNIANQNGPFDIASKGIVQRIGHILGLGINSYKVPDLRWEKTATINFGTDLSLFNKRLDLTLDYYRKEATDILATTEIDPTYGTGSMFRNEASIVNHGYEIMLTSHNISNEKLVWDTQFSFTYNKGEVKEVGFNKNERRAYSYAGTVLSLKGSEPNSLYVFDYAGLDNQGYAQIRKADGNIVKIDNTLAAPNLLVFDDLKLAGTTRPKYLASVNNNIYYKGFGLSFLFVYQGGHVTIKDSYDGEYIDNNIFLVNKDVEKAWNKAGDENFTDIPKISSATYSRIVRGSTKNVIPADFIRLRDVVLSYTIPSEYSKMLNINELTFNFRAGNLWLWTKNKEGIDPETQALGIRTAKLQKSYTFGINLIF